MCDDGLRHVPAFPACTRGSVTEVDVLPVKPVALVEAAQLVEHLSAKEKEGAEHPLSLDRTDGTLVELVVGDLSLLRVDEPPQRRAADDRARDRREQPPGGL